VPELRDKFGHPFSARLWYAYAEALLAAGRPDEARQAFGKAIEFDPEGETDAIDRLDEADGITVSDLAADDDDEDLDDLADDEDADDIDDADDDDADDDLDDLADDDAGGEHDAADKRGE
jgi:tetratricopeptide (TPR) repeat protein